MNNFTSKVTNYPVTVTEDEKNEIFWICYDIYEVKKIKVLYTLIPFM